MKRRTLDRLRKEIRRAESTGLPVEQLAEHAGVDRSDILAFLSDGVGMSRENAGKIIQALFDHGYHRAKQSISEMSVHSDVSIPPKPFHCNGEARKPPATSGSAGNPTRENAREAEWRPMPVRIP